MSALEVLSTLAGGLVVALTLCDIFYSVLFPASDRGPLRKRLERAVWSVFGVLGRRTTGRRRANLLSYGGPVQVLTTLLMWPVLLALGWALVFWPALGESVRVASGATGTDFATALYFSGSTLSTLGIGDLVAHPGPYRVLVVTESVLGFGVFTMVITYFLSIYSALPGRNAFALRLHHLSRDTDDAAVIVGALLSDDPAVAREELARTAEFLRQTTETHRSYPVLRYFHYQRDYYGLPQVLLMALEAAALVESSVEPEAARGLPHATVVDEVGRGAEALLDQLLVGARTRPTDTTLELWRRRHGQACDILRGFDVSLRPREDALEDYVDRRRVWDAKLAALADSMLHVWSTDLTAPPGVAHREHAAGQAGSSQG